MENTALIDLESIAKQLKLPLPGVQRAAELLEEGNTVPFITRFRKDQTGGLDEQQTRAIELELKRAKLLAERKETILKSIESRGKLTDKLAGQIKKTRVLGDLEDIYLPYKPKKQSLASVARARGLEPFATAVLEAQEATSTLEEMAAAYVDESKDVPTAEAAIEGLKHLVAEHFGHHRQIRAHLRRHLSKNGKLVCKKIDQPEEATDKSTGANTDSAAEEPTPPQDSPAEATSNSVDTVENTDAEGVAKEAVATQTVASDPAPVEESISQSDSVEPTVSATAEEGAADQSVSEDASGVATATVSSEDEASTATSGSDVDVVTEAIATDASSEPNAAPTTAGETDSHETQETATEDDAAQETATGTQGPDKAAAQATDAKPAAKKDDSATSRRDQRREMRRRRRERLVQSFKDYFDCSDPIGRLPHHRILAINRGERTKVLRVKVECSDWDKVQEQTEKVAIRPEHPYASFLRECLQDAMQRLLQPSIEREVRRDLNERAEEHAVTVFARNLRKLLLQPPLRNHRVIAIDPGFRSGCKVVALDQFGQLLGHTFINLLGKDQQKQDGRAALASFVKEHNATVVAVGNGAASRETETLVAEVLSDELKDQQVGYLIVNEAGTSVYSTSELGREELPDMDATLRSAVSIGRRALDPLSELVKIDPANIGVGLYQHDVKAKHLRESLDNVVESCVNYVGVDVNSASPALLGYVSGLNTLTARKIYEHRLANGPFKNREQLKEVSGIGDSTYIQAAGFLRIVGGENPLDGTWIHPESYPTATKVLEAIGFAPDDLRTRPGVANGAPANPVETVSEPAEGPSTDTVVNEAGTAESPVAEPTDSALPSSSEAEVSASDDQNGDVTESPDATPERVSDSTPDAKTEEAQAAETATADESNDAASSADTSGSSAGVSDASAPEVASSDSSSCRMKEITEKLSQVDVAALSTQLDVGKLSLEDMLNALARPGRDPREDLPPPIFRTGVLKLEDLKAGMELSGTVLNVVDFGAFVDIGLVDSGLIHVSRLADRYISDPHDIVSVGDILRVWVVEVDQKRRRVSLTAIEPGTEKPKTPREGRRRNSRAGDNRKSEQGAQRSGQGAASGSRRSGRGGKPQGHGKKPRGKGTKPKNRSKARPKPVVPITKEMEDGTEPMRTFGDLKQLFDKKKRKDSK